MKYSKIIYFFVFFGAVLTAYSLMNRSHQFADNECIICHKDAKNTPADLKPVTSSICVKCHADRRQKLSHPIDIRPQGFIPADMPLVEGKLSCFSCHFVHPFSVKYQNFTRFLLRRPGRGPAFCSACHAIDKKGHMVFENAHLGSFQVTDRTGHLDAYSLQCIECHDKHLTDAPGTLGAGNWKHRTSANLNHPIGFLFSETARKFPKKFNPPGMLPKEIRLFNGRTGCGTCHDVYSREKGMLVMNNYRSRLCLQCHIM